MNKKTYVCVNCGKTFERLVKNAKRSKHNYCSLKCYNSGRHEDALVTCICAKCGKTFQLAKFLTKDSFNHYCSLECNYKKLEGKHHSPETIEKIRAIKRPKGKQHHNWGGGCFVTSAGYVKVWTEDGYRFEHHLVMEQQIKRRLTDDEVVHHINGNKSDNRIENLQLTTKSEHSHLHNVKQNLRANSFGYTNSECPNCKKIFQHHSYIQIKYCSYDCYFEYMSKNNLWKQTIRMNERHETQ
ncbi:MAG: HNH endonuclease signature motif containing protein [Candidatus Babeliales bacterium]|jgi:DNA-directed RNA polymerase subunit RPC12/RpoP